MNSLIVLMPLTIAIYLALFANVLRAVDLVVVPAFGYCLAWLSAAVLLWDYCICQTPDQYVECFRFFTWSSLGGAEVGFSVWIDHVTIVMTFTVLTVSICVQLFSLYYMIGDPHFVRFFVFLSLFTFCMLLLVAAEDLLQLFIGWEAVGLCSYVLINFWYTRIQANKSALKAILINRVGDFGFFMALCLIFVDYGTLNIYELSYLVAFKAPYSVDYVGVSGIEVICFCLFIAVMSKSAQLGLHTWLPDAMEGPTPVSALIHAATMVTAGIFLMLRTAPFFILAPRVLIFVSIVGSLTMLFGATTALAQNDMKKVIAFSTCSQLGYMVAACGLGQFSAAFFHLITHAFFKALLFLCGGVIIHSCSGEQDVRGLGGLRNSLPLVYVAMSIASFSLMGLPFLSGFYSKELIINLACFDTSWTSWFVGLIAIISAVCTSLYSVKLLLWLFWTVPRQQHSWLVRTHTGFDLRWMVPLATLSFFSIISGFFLREVLVGIGSAPFAGPMADYITTPALLNRVEFGETPYKVALLELSFVGFIYLNVRMSFSGTSPFFVPSKQYVSFFRFFHYRWCLDLIYSWYLTVWFWRAVHYFIFLTVQQQVVDRLTLEIHVRSTEAGSQLVVESNGVTPRQYLTCFLTGVILTSALFIFLFNPDALYYQELAEAIEAAE